MFDKNKPIWEAPRFIKESNMTNWPQTLWIPQNTQLICRRMAGLQEKCDHNTSKVHSAALAAFVCAAAVSEGSRLSLPFSAVIVLAGVAGAIAGVALTIHYLRQRKQAYAWLKTFELIAERRYDLAEPELKKLLEPQCLKSWASLDPQYGSIYDRAQGNNYDPITRGIGHALLMIACHKANNDSNPKDWSQRRQVSKGWNEDLDLANKYIDRPNHCLGDINPDAVIADLRTKNPPFIALPFIKSPGHGVLLTIVDWTSGMNVYKDFDAKGNLVMHRGAHLEKWQATLRKCQSMMISKKAFGNQERSLISSLLKTSNMRDFVRVLQGISPEQRKDLEKALLHY